MGADVIPAWFHAQMARLADLRFPPVSLEGHWSGLAGVPEAIVEAAIIRALQTRSAFPSAAELREDMDQVAPLVRPLPPVEDRGTDLVAPRVIGTLPTGAPITQTRVWRDYCEVCGDTGLRAWWCGDTPSSRWPWLAVRRCGIRNCAKVGYAHEWVERCVCYDTNPALVRKRAAQQRYAEAKSATGRAR